MNINLDTLWRAIETIEPNTKMAREAGAKFSLTTMLNTAAIAAFIRSVAQPKIPPAAVSMDYAIACEYVMQALTELRDNGCINFADNSSWGRGI